MNIIKKRTPKILSATCLSFVLILGVPAPVGGEPLFHDSAFAPQLAQTEPFVDTLGKRQELQKQKETIQSVVEDIQTNYSQYLLATTQDFLNKNLENSQSAIDEETLQKIFNDCNIIYEQVKIAKAINEEQQRKAALEEAIKTRGQIIETTSYNTASPGYGLCAAWVSMVIDNAGLSPISGNANDMYWNYCYSSDKNEIREGMIIAVPTHNLTYLGGIYGHVGIIIQHSDGVWYVIDNIGYIREIPLDEWINTYGTISEVKWGWTHPV